MNDARKRELIIKWAKENCTYRPGADRALNARAAVLYKHFDGWLWAQYQDFITRRDFLFILTRLGFPRFGYTNHADVRAGIALKQAGE